jgi:hypothetical protein
MTPEELLRNAVRKVFVTEDSADSEDHLDWAKTILSYVNARTQITGQAMGEIRKRIQSEFPDVRFGVILNKDSFDWTGGADFEGMVGKVDEVWCDVEVIDVVPNGIEVYAYALDRSRYWADAFFEYASDRRFIATSLGIRRADRTKILSLIHDRYVKYDTANNLSLPVVTAFKNMDFLSGFVGNIFNNTIYERILSHLRREITKINKAGEDKNESAEEVVDKERVLAYIATLAKWTENEKTIGRDQVVGLAQQLFDFLGG